MFKNYLKIAWRNITTRKFYTFLNICGLTLAIGCCTLIYLYISYNLSFDTYHKDADKIFRVVYELHLDKIEYDKASSVAMEKALKPEVPQIQQSVFLVNNQSFIVDVSGDTQKRFKEEKTIAFADADWFKLFSYQWLQGSPQALNQPGNVVLNQKTAIKYFGTADAVGKVLLIEKQLLKVTGVVADKPYNTDLKNDMYISFSSILSLIPSYGKDFFTDWGYLNSGNSTFVSLKDAAQKDAVEKELAVLTEKHLGKDGAKYYHFKLLPLKEIHFDTRYGGTVQKSLLVTLTVIGLLIIAIAVINYINIMIAQQTKRGVEIGTRKVLGGSSKQIFMQFITESALTASIAVAVAILLVQFTLPSVNRYLFADEPVHILSYAKLGLYMLIVLVLMTVGTGAYPAFILSRISIARALKNNILNLPAGIGRKILVVFQNTITQALIVCTIIIVMQVHFLKNTDMGFNRKMVVTIPADEITASQRAELNQSLKSMPAVQSFSFCNKPPSSDSKRGATLKYDTRTQWEKWPARFAIGDSAYCHTFGLQLIAGRNIRDKQAIPEFLLNQTMARMLEGRNENNVIGKNLNAGDTKGVIVGIVKDFNVKSLIEPIEPSILLENDHLQNTLAVKLNGEHTAATLNELQTVYQRTFPDQVFSYQFVDEQIAGLYKRENIQQKLIWMAAVLAIFISSLGLLGLISLTALQRTKEIGIRKVLGASVTQISLLLSNDFLRMIVIAFVIAAPVSWWAMHTWLQNFAYHINVQWWVFALAGSLSIIIAVCSVGFQAVKAAVANPVNSLRSE